MIPERKRKPKTSAEAVELRAALSAHLVHIPMIIVRNRYCLWSPNHYFNCGMVV